MTAEIKNYRRKTMTKLTARYYYQRPGYRQKKKIFNY